MKRATPVFVGCLQLACGLMVSRAHFNGVHASSRQARVSSRQDLETGPRDRTSRPRDGRFLLAKEYQNSIFNVTAFPQEGAIWILVFLDLCSSVKSVVQI
jgi:hypothetical protein